MNITGIIAEYNPFHNGHLRHLEETRRRTGCDAVVVVMSGDFVQRGVPSVTDKYLRAKAALRCGADLVLELPVFGATASAEDFASAGVRAMESLSCVRTLSYGAEDADEAGSFRDIAEYLLSEPPAYKSRLLALVKEGNSYAKARSLALAEFFPKASEILTKPNNILGVEYEKAILRDQTDITTCVIERNDRGYHDTRTAPVCSATAIRQAVLEQDRFPADSIPECTKDLFAGLTRSTAVTADDASDMLCAELSAHTPETLSAIYDTPGDLANRILNRTEQPFTWTSLAESVKNKAFTRSRIDRSLCHALLHITEADADAFKASPALPYLRVLGVRKGSEQLLSELCGSSATPLLRRLSDDTKLLSREAQHLLSVDLRASALYSQILFRKTGIVRADTRRRLLTV